MKQLPDILTSTSFWASVGTLWAAAGAWFTYVAAAIDSRRKTYEDVSNLVEGLEAEMRLVSECVVAQPFAASFSTASALAIARPPSPQKE
jgi:hypothetical protein